MTRRIIVDTPVGLGTSQGYNQTMAPSTSRRTLARSVTRRWTVHAGTTSTAPRAAASTRRKRFRLTSHTRLDPLGMS